MAFWLDGWCGDNAGDVIGREPNTLLIALTTEGGEYPPGLFLRSEAMGVTSYYECSVECLMPNARNAIATNIAPMGSNLFAVQLAELDLGGGREPWAKGIHLFGLSLYKGANQAATIATAHITDDVPSVKPDRTALWGLASARYGRLPDAGPDPGSIRRQFRRSSGDSPLDS